MLESGAKNAFTPWQPASSARSIMESSCHASERARVISKAAHYLAQHCGIDSGPQSEDWLKAELEVDSTTKPRR
jgi:hypothetical protein